MTSALQSLTPPTSIFNAADYNKFTYNDCEAVLIQENNEKALNLRFGSTKPWPGIVFNTGALSIPSNWSDYSYISVAVSNPNDFPVNISICVDSSNGDSKILQSAGTVNSGSKARLNLFLGPDAIVPGMVGQPPVISQDKNLQNITLAGAKGDRMVRITI